MNICIQINLQIMLNSQTRDIFRFSFLSLIKSQPCWQPTFARNLKHFQFNLFPRFYEIKTTYQTSISFLMTLLDNCTFLHWKFIVISWAEPKAKVINCLIKQISGTQPRPLDKWLIVISLLLSQKLRRHKPLENTPRTKFDNSRWEM